MPLTRRNALFAGLCLCCAPAFARRADAAPDVPPGPFQTDEVAPGIFIRHGAVADASKANEDAIANTGFVVGRDSVAVLDPGGSLEDGESLRATILAKTKLPIRYVLLSHVHPDHVFGAGAFQQDNPVFVGHANLPMALGQRGAFYQKGLDALLGPGKAGPVVMPTMLVKDQAEIDLGGRVIALTAHGPAHTDNDLSAFDKQTGTLLPFDLLFVHRIPSLDGSLKGWIHELAALKKVSASRVVPGHGPVSLDWPGAAADEERYFHVLLRETRRAVANAAGIDEAVTTVGQSERGKWALFDHYNGRNVTEAYKELEWE